MPNKDLYNGKEVTVWTDTFGDNGERFAEIIFHANGVSMNFPSNSLHSIADEIMKASKMLELIDKKFAR